MVDLDYLAGAAARLFGADAAGELRAQLQRSAEAIATLRAYPLPASTMPFTLPAQAGASAGDAGGPASIGSGPGEGAVRPAAQRSEVSLQETISTLLARIEQLEPVVRAWVAIDPSLRQRAAELDGTAGLRGPLHGLTVGIKDIFDVHGLPTRAGSALRADAGPAERDSAVAARLRAAGALILGKTATTEFAAADPAETVNPWNPGHTPAGSSSGSAAAVAAGMIDAAIGSQTAGSVLRPASFCGVVGFKPSYGAIETAGMLPFSWSLDTPGIFAAGVSVARRLFAVLRADGGPALQPAGEQRPAPRIAYLPELLAERIQPAMRAAIEDAVQAVRAAGAIVSRADTPAAFAVALDTHHLIMVGEGAAYHLASHGDRLSGLRPGLRRLVMAGAALPASAYLLAQRVRRDLNERMLPLFEDYDLLLTAAAPGAAPAGLSSTGDPALNAPWSLLGWPAISLPAALDAGGLPLGLQLVGRPGGDDALLAGATWCEAALGFSARPSLRFG